MENLLELNSDQVYEAAKLMNWNQWAHPQGMCDVSDMQGSECGPWERNKVMPKFLAVPMRFVQILNIGDHWICATNVFGQTTHDVFLYDSLYSTVANSTVVQVSCTIIYLRSIPPLVSLFGLLCKVTV